ncbi:hypothetical protein CPB85DRAFT_1255623 [Mucidula mucida]|nr:hypothetical protein CPB85DRAFT_1255623 [Mucidula mucida]
MPPKDKFQPKDLLVNRPRENAPPTGPVQVCAEGHFGAHDPTCAPQFYNDCIPHFVVFPTLPTDQADPYYPYRHMWNVPTESDMDWRTGQLVGVGLLKHFFFVRCWEAVNWAVERANIYYNAKRERAQPNAKIIHFLDMCLPCLQQSLSCLESVTNNLTSICILMNGLFRLWLDISASIDWMTMYQPVLRHERAFCDLPTLPTTLSVFTFEHYVVKMFSITPNIPVFYICPLSHFNTQHILKVVPIVEHPSYAPPPGPYPTIFTGLSDDPAKFLLPGSFPVLSDKHLQFYPLAPRHGYQRRGLISSSSIDQAGKLPKKPKPMDPKAHNLLKDCTCTPYSPPLHPGWRVINVEVKTNFVEEKRRLQRQSKEPLLAAKYMLPPPGLFLCDSLPDEHFSALFAQYNHIFPALVYRITSQHSNAPALSNQEWRDVLFLARQQGTEEGQLTTCCQEALAKTAASLGDALSSGGVQFKPICPTPAGGFALPSLEEGETRYGVFLNLPDADEEAAAQED